MSENIIKEGDFVRVRGRETSCEVLIAKEGINAIAVEETRKYATTYNREEVERIDPKTAFLHDLSDLLRKYDAEFSDYENYEVIFNLGDKMSIFIDTTDVFNWTNADNLLERATFSDDK